MENYNQVNCKMDRVDVNTYSESDRGYDGKEKVSFKRK